MERAGLLTRRSFSESPPRVEYSLTHRGQSLLPVLTEMRRSVLLWDDLGHHDLDCKACAASNKEEKATDMAAQIADATVTDPGRQAKPATSERGLRKRRDVTLL